MCGKLWCLLDNLPFAFPTLLLLTPIAYWLALTRLPDASLRQTAALTILLAAVIGAAAQGIITAVDLAVWPDAYFLEGSNIVAYPYIGFERAQTFVSELVILPPFNLVLTIPAALLGVACAWLAAPWIRLWGVVRIGSSSQSLRLVVGEATAAAVALGVTQVLTATTVNPRDISYDLTRSVTSDYFSIRFVLNPNAWPSFWYVVALATGVLLAVCASAATHYLLTRAIGNASIPSPPQQEGPVPPPEHP